VSSLSFLHFAQAVQRVCVCSLQGSIEELDYLKDQPAYLGNVGDEPTEFLLRILLESPHYKPIGIEGAICLQIGVEKGQVQLSLREVLKQKADLI
jgi:hypothetical protein